MSAPTSTAEFAVHQVGPGTWSVQRKAVPGFKPGMNSSVVTTQQADAKERA